MDEVLNTAWDPILRKYKDGPEPEYEPFRDRFQDHIGPHMMEAGTITGEELRILLRKKPKKSASGVDGWRMAELRELPLPLLNALADVMNLVEATGDWPASMTTALVSMVPKDESQDPLHTRPITVTSAVYRLWACRRLADIVLWQEGWIEEGQKGFRPGHRIEDVLMEIGLEVEDALLDGEPLYGVALDFRKCFDMVPREVVLRLAEDLGLHGRVLKPLRAIYSLLARRFKLPLGVGREFSVTNGILQGCPVSVILINALLSVVMKAVKKEAEGVSPKSYADDATLLSRLSEAALQKGVDIVDEFCTLTGMQLNLEKTIAFSTRQRHQSTLRLRSGNALLRFSKSVTCLGALVSTAKNRKERSDSKRVERAAALAEGLRHAPFRYEKRVRIVQSNVLPAALSGCSFAPVSKVAMKRLTTSVMGLIWGGANPKRAREMVLNFQEKGHLTDPGTCLAYRVTTAFYAACERLPRLLPLMESIRGRYAEGDQPLGPVGLAMRSMEECGHIWEPGPLSRTLRRNGAVFDPLASSPSKRGHEVRADLRTRTWARLMARRPGYQGLERADLERTNAFWKTRECSAHTAKLIRVAIAGGVNTAEFTSRMRQAGAEPQAPSCKHCGSGVTENEQHIYWDCDAYSHIRRREAHAGLMAANRTEWPRCTLEHGVVVPGNAHLSRRLQEMMAEILAERAGLEARGWVARNPTTPWSRADAMPAEKFDHPFARIAPAWTWERNKTWGLPTFYALVAWLSDMQWTESGQASMLELAIDFELFSGLSMPLHGNAPKGVRERGNVLRCMMSALDKLAAQQGLGSCMRGERVCPTTSLSFMGISGISGVRPRPRFREAHTGTILEEQVKGSDVGTQCPAYPDWTIGRAARWALPAPPQLHPDPVHMPGVDIEKALVTCATHHKGKCEACRALVRRDVPTVEMCCRHHHHANDGQPIAVCTEHSTTKCGECKTAAACCRSGHHACRTHGRGTCQECKRLPTLTQRRPAACCRRGHHQSNEPNVPSTPGRNKKKRPSSPTQVGVQRGTPVGKRAAQAPPAATKKETATTGRATKRPPPTPGTSERPALKKGC
ncbi:Retrovirus-related Pol polyprotein from type-1 retrotransposable element R2 [Diplonema papillatum]|nr:Retrovirus-related Pol polyprotein from type-1 retrotransposable element R2 [Diplonema papillatum]